MDGYIEIKYLYNGFSNHVQIFDNIYFDCLKEDLEKKGELNYLYIKYVKEPIIIGNYNALSYTFSYRGKEYAFAYFG